MKLFVVIILILIQWNSLNAQSVVDDCHSNQSLTQTVSDCQDFGSIHDTEDRADSSQQQPQNEKCHHNHSCSLKVLAFVQESLNKLVPFINSNGFNEFQSFIKPSPHLDGPFQPPRHS